MVCGVLGGCIASEGVGLDGVESNEWDTQGIS